MCGAVEFQRAKPLEGSLGLLPPEVEIIRVTFPNPRAALRIDMMHDLWLPWGRRAAQEGDWPQGGWAREESLDKAYWTRWEPDLVSVFPSRWMEKDARGRSHWFDLQADRGLLCLRLRKAPGTPLYVVTETSRGAFRDVHDRMPKVSAG